MLHAQLLSAFSHSSCYLQANRALLMLIPSGWVCVHSRTPWVCPTSSPARLGVSSAVATPTGFYSQRFLKLSFPTLEPLVAQSILLPSCSSPFICTQIWDHPVCHLMPCQESCPPSCPSQPFLLVWMNVSSLTPWLSDFHTVWFSGSLVIFCFQICCCPSFVYARRQSLCNCQKSHM